MADFTLKLDLITRQILQAFDAELIVVFGNTGESAHDIDLVIVASDFDGVSSYKRRELLQRIDTMLDPICLTPHQFRQLKASDSALFQNLTNHGTIIYGNKRSFL